MPAAGIPAQLGGLGGDPGEAGATSHAHRVYSRSASPSDVIYASVIYKGGDTFYLAVTDTNAKHGWHWHMTLTESTEHGAPTSAEWIVEAGGGPLADFHHVTSPAARTRRPRPAEGSW